MKIDLHIHSDASADGEYTAEEIVRKCIQNKIEVFSITDHESVENIEEGLRISREMGIKMIPAVEIFSHIDNKLFHILGYGIQYKNKAINDLLEKITKSRVDNAKIQFERIRQFGLSISEKDAYANSTTKAMLPAAYVKAIFMHQDNKNHPLLKGTAPTTDNFLRICRDYFSYGKPLYASEFVPTVEETIEIIKECGGVAVLAHPGIEFKDNYQQRDFYLNRFLQIGIDGIEVYHSGHTKKQCKFYRDFSMRNNLIMTYGSDFHGILKPDISLGFVPEENSEDIIRKLEQAIENVNKSI